MGQKIVISEDIFKIIEDIQVAANLVAEASLIYSSAMESFSDGGSGYKGKAEDNTKMLSENLVANVDKLSQYYTIASQYLQYIVYQFMLEDENLSKLIQQNM